MSKSKGNVINPLDIVEKYGADALRMALIIRSSAGLDKSVAENDFRAMRNFTNKIWNAARFVLMQNEKNSDKSSKSPSDDNVITYTEANVIKNDNVFTSKLNDLISQVTINLNHLQLGLAAETAYNSFWHYYCDEIIELQKNGGLSLKALNQGLITYLKLLHPFTPFVTEQVWQEIASIRTPDDEKDLIISKWPTLS